MVIKFALETGGSASCRGRDRGDPGRRPTSPGSRRRQPAAAAWWRSGEVAQALKEAGPTTPNGSTCSRRSSRTSR